ncbi:MAG: efflux RND transporter periplasmic adaptor subunit [Devosia sp.]
MIGRIVSAFVVLLLVAGAAWALWPRPVTVEVAAIARGNLAVTIEEEGVSRIGEVFRVTAPVAGRLVRVAMHAGDAVKAGQTVATIEPAPPGLLDERSRLVAQATAEAAQASVQLAEAALAQAEAQSSYAASDAKRKSALAERGLVSTQIEEQSALAVATASRNVDVARATLAMRQQELASARATLIEGADSPAASRCCANVPSPVTGQVLDVLTESEQAVQPGTPLLDLGDPANMEIAVDVLSSDAVRITPGAPATVEGWGGEPLRAQVKSISPTAATKVSALGIEEQRTEVVLDLLDPRQTWARLGHGFRVVAHIVVWEGTDRILVPIGALFRDGDAWAVFTVEAGKAKQRTITLGQRNSSYAEVTGGLEPGDLVVIHPGDTVADGVSVKHS